MVDDLVTQQQTPDIQDQDEKKTLVVKLGIPNMASFTRPSKTDFPKPEDAAKLSLLELQEQTLRNQEKVRDDGRARITYLHGSEKDRIIRSLHGHIMFVLDEHGVPLKIELPTASGASCTSSGVKHSLRAEDWKDVLRHQDVNGIEWPPTNAENLLQAMATRNVLDAL